MFVKPADVECQVLFLMGLGLIVLHQDVTAGDINIVSKLNGDTLWRIGLCEFFDSLGDMCHDRLLSTWEHLDTVTNMDGPVSMCNRGNGILAGRTPFRRGGR